VRLEPVGTSQVRHDLSLAIAGEPLQHLWPRSGEAASAHHPRYRPGQESLRRQRLRQPEERPVMLEQVEVASGGGASFLASSVRLWTNASCSLSNARVWWILTARCMTWASTRHDSPGLVMVRCSSKA